MTERQLAVAVLALILGLLVLQLSLLDRKATHPLRLVDLIINRRGKTDLAACAFWLLLLLNIWVIATVVLLNSVPEGLGVLMGTFNTAFALPIVAKVIVGGMPPKDPPS